MAMVGIPKDLGNDQPTLASILQGEAEGEGYVIRRLMPTDWKTGEALWLTDFVAPFGMQEAMVEELRLKILSGKRMKMQQARPEGGTGVVEW
jgi:hemolysin-activating ACP:hemolysin acyltransferase